MLKILHVYEDSDFCNVLKMKAGQIIRWLDFTRVKEPSQLYVRKCIHSTRGPSMYGDKYLRIVCMLVVLMCSRT